jgi:transposase-like protein
VWHPEGRKDTRPGSYDRHLQTKDGEVTLTAPKLRNLPFETAIIERYRRRESSVEEALIGSRATQAFKSKYIVYGSW